MRASHELALATHVQLGRIEGAIAAFCREIRRLAQRRGSTDRVLFRANGPLLLTHGISPMVEHATPRRAQ